jgi:hypothetical protein
MGEAKRRGTYEQRRSESIMLMKPSAIRHAARAIGMTVESYIRYLNAARGTDDGEE